MSDLGRAGLNDTDYGFVVVPYSEAPGWPAALSDKTVRLIAVDPDADPKTVARVRAALAWRYGTVSILVGAAGAIVLAVLMPLLLGASAPGTAVGAVLAVTLWVIVTILVGKILDRRARMSETTRTATALVTPEHETDVERCVLSLGYLTWLFDEGKISEEDWEANGHGTIWHFLDRPESRTDGLAGAVEFFDAFIVSVEGEPEGEEFDDDELDEATATGSGQDDWYTG